MESGSNTYFSESSSQSEHVTIRLTNPTIKDDRFSKHVTYTIIGEDSKGAFEAQRRYKEFNALQILLNLQWPGCFIPQIPEKKVIGNLQDNFIEKRRKLLEIFLIKVCACSFLLHSDEVQTFLRGPADFLKISKDYKADNYIQLVEKYSHHFKEFSERLEPDEVDNQLEDYLKFYKLTLENFEAFEIACTESVSTFENYAKETSLMLYGIKEINQFYTTKYNVKEINLIIREECTNPYQILLDWVQAEILDIKGIILAILKKKEMLRARVRAVEKVEEEKKSLSKAQTGKKSWKSMLSKQTKEQKIAKIEAEILEAQKELDTIKLIEHILNVRLTSYELPKFKESKAERYEMILKMFVNTSVEEFESLIQQARQIDFLYTFSN